METWTQVAGNAAFFLAPMLALLAAQEIELRRHARKLAEERRIRSRR